MRRSDRILRERDDEGPSAQLSFDLKTIAKRAAIKRIGSSPIKQTGTLRGPSIQKPPHAIGVPLHSISPGGSNTAETSKGQLKRPRRHQQRRLRSSSEDIYDVGEASPDANGAKSGVSAYPEFTTDTESSDESSSSYVECEEIIGIRKTPKKPSEVPLVLIESAPAAAPVGKIAGRGGAASGGFDTSDSSDADGRQDKVAQSEKADHLVNLTGSKGNPLLDSEYEPTSSDADGYEDEDEDGREEVLERENVGRQKDVSEDEMNLEFSDTDIYNEYGLRNDSVFWEASKIFDQEQNWRELTSEAQKLVEQAKGLTVGSTKNLFGSISNGIDTYKESIDSKDKHRSFTSIGAEQNYITGLERRVSQALIDLYPYNADLPSKLPKLASMAYEVATDIIPGMVGLLQWCLVAHYSNDSVTAEGIDQLMRILESLGKLCEAIQAEPPKPPPELADKIRITSVLVRFMSYVFRHQQLNTRQPATTQPRIGWTRNPGSLRDKHDADSAELEEPIAIVQEKRPWSRAESEILFDALRKYRGPGRYDLILRELRDVLGHRSVEELREKTMETRAGLLALPDEKRPHYSQWSFLDE